MFILFVLFVLFVAQVGDGQSQGGIQWERQSYRGPLGNDLCLCGMYIIICIMYLRTFILKYLQPLSTLILSHTLSHI